MKSYEAGHRETRTKLPEPLAKTGLWDWATFALPSSQLSFASAVTFVTVSGFLALGGAEQKLFVLPFPGAFIIGFVAAALAWWIVLQGRRRPGRIWPRIWALSLACLNSVIALLVLVFHDRSWPLTLAVAGLAAAATLTPRLMKLRPDSSLVQYIAPLSLLILIIIVPSSCAVRHVIARETERRVDRRIQQFRLWTTEVKEITSFDWWRMEESPDAAAKAVGNLKKLRFAGEIDDAELWRSAAILGKDTDLALAIQGLGDEVVAGFSTERVPRVSDLKEPAVRWDDQQKHWEAYSQFTSLSGITGTYHQELGRLFVELAVPDKPLESAKLDDYRQHYLAERKVLQSHLNESAGTWADNWAVFKVPHHGELLGRESASLNEVLRAPFVKSEEGTLAAGDLWQLTSLPLSRVRRFAMGAPGCEGGESAGGRSSPTRQPKRAPGCRCQSFEEGEHEYFRLDCYSYTPQNQGAGAALRIEMRIVYESPLLQRLRQDSWPSEVYFHFLLPNGEDGDKFRETVMTDLAAAARGTSQDSVIRSTDKGGSVAGGFVIHAEDASVRVLRPSIVSLNGLTPESKALRVRVVRAADVHHQFPGG